MTELDAFLADVSRSQYGWPESLRFTYDKTRELLAAGVPGDLVECGVGAGCHPAVMARACQDAGETRTVRLFDSFRGVPNGGAHDRDWNSAHGDGSGRLEPTGVAACTLDTVQQNLEGWGCDGSRFAFHPGWFQHTLPPLVDGWKARGAIAFLRLDGDLYESTLVCLQMLYPIVSSGGVVVLDDWNLDGCRRAFLDFFQVRVTPDFSIVSEAPSGCPVPQPITESGDVWWTKP